MYNKFIEHRTLSSFPDHIISEINLMSVSKKHLADPYGSAIYRLQKYPGDIDLIENLMDYGTKDQVVDRFIVAFKKVVKRVQSSKMHYYSEVKAGLDDRYKIDVGSLTNGVYKRSKELIPKVNYLFNNGLIHETDYDLIILAAKGKTANNYDVVKFILREYYVLRWSAKQILADKNVNMGKTFTIKDAIMDSGVDTLFKLDEITIILGKFAEVTNVYQLDYAEKGGDDIIPVIGPPDDVVKQLKLEVEKLYYSNIFYNPFKIIKRMFALAQTPKHRGKPEYNEIIMKIARFVSGDTSMLYQLKSELEAILVVIEKTKAPPIATINKQIDSMKFRLSTYLKIESNELEQLNILINDIIAAKGEQKVELIERMKKLIKKVINYETITFMDKAGLNPPPLIMLPDEIRYNRNMVRTPKSNPISPITLLKEGLNIDSETGIEQKHPQHKLSQMILQKPIEDVEYLQGDGVQYFQGGGVQYFQEGANDYYEV